MTDCGVDWWLRSPGKKQNKAVYILGKSANLIGNEVDYATPGYQESNPALCAWECCFRLGILYSFPSFNSFAPVWW